MLTLVDLVQDQGGAERFAVGLAGHLPTDEFESWICSTRRAEPATVAALERRGVRHLGLDRRRRLDLAPFWQLIRLLRRHRFDVLHAHKFGSNLWGVLLGRVCGVPVVIAHEHTWSYEGNPVRAWLDGRVIGRLATRFVAVSAADARRMVQIEHVPRERIVVIPATVFAPRDQPADSDLRGELGLASDTPLIFTAAVLRPQKALRVMLEALALLRRRGFDAHLAIAGDGEEREALLQLARELGVTDAAHLLGRRADVEALLNTVDIGTLSSDYEGTPLFLAECVTHGVPIVATDVGGIPDVVIDGESALLVPRRDPSALAAAYQRLIERPDEGRRLAAAARRGAGEMSIDAVARRFAALYRELVAERGSRSG